MHNGAIMPSEVRHLVDIGQTYPVVRLTGMLDAATAPTVRSVLLTMLAQQPEAVVVDVTDLQVVDPLAVAVFQDVQRETADWPAAQSAAVYRRCYAGLLPAAERVLEMELGRSVAG